MKRFILFLALIGALNVSVFDVAVAMPADSDGDGVDDTLDNCTVVANPGQQDADGDGHGNHCDADLDNNCGAVNIFDLFAFKAAFGIADPVADLNASGGAVNIFDLFAFKTLFGVPPGPSAPGSLCNPFIISALTVSNIGADNATISFTTTPAVTATIRVWLQSDNPASPAIQVVSSASAATHIVPLTGLWSSAPLRVEVTAGQSQATTSFQTAAPAWPANACRTGAQSVPIDGNISWTSYTDSNGSVNVQADTGCGGAGSGVRMDFDLGNGEWVVTGSNFASPVDLTAYSHLWIPFRGTAGATVALEIKLRDATSGLSIVRLDQGSGLPVWRSWAVDLREFSPQTGNSVDLSAVTGMEVGFSSPLSMPGPRSGVVELGDLQAWNIANERPLVAGLERVNRDEPAMSAIAADLLARQQSHGFLPAWFSLAPNWHLYANAMALIVFTLEYERLANAGDPSAMLYENAAIQLADALVMLQTLSNRGGAWDDSFAVVNGQLVLHPPWSRVLWVGSTAWAGISLILARDILPTGADYNAAVAAAAAFYSGYQGCRNQAGLPNGSITEGTEGNISSHLFLDAASARGFVTAAVPDSLAAFISGNLYDPVQERFFCGVSIDFGSGFDLASCSIGGSGVITGHDARSCLDVIGNWGTEWLVREGRVADALMGLAYARHVFPVHAFTDTAVHGLGDIAGPWMPSVEMGAGQWATAGGPDSNYLIAEALQHLCQSGACQGASDDFAAGIGWNTISSGIAPAAWVYIALHGGFWNQL